MSRRYVSFDSEGEPWLDNPQLIIANPRHKRKRVRSLPNLSSLFGSRVNAPHKKGKKMAKKKHRKMTALQLKYFGPRRKKTNKPRHARMFSGRLGRKFARKFRRRHSYRGLLVARGGKSHVTFKTNRRKSYRHSTEGGGIALPFGLRAPAVKDMAFGALGLFVPGMITSRVLPYVPVSMQGNQVVTWVVKIASVLVPGYLLRKFYDSRAGYAFMIGGAASLLIDAIKTFVPTIAQQIGLAYYPGGVTVGMGFQPLLGDYSVNQRKQVAAQAQKTTPILLGVPDRLNPAGRF